MRSLEKYDRVRTSLTGNGDFLIVREVRAREAVLVDANGDLIIVPLRHIKYSEGYAA